MPFVTMNSKGQITVPRIIRERLNLRTGKCLEFRITKEGEVFMAPVSVTLDEVAGMLRRPGHSAITVQAMNKAQAKRFKKNGL